jgi:hypothetical protein
MRKSIDTCFTFQRYITAIAAEKTSQPISEGGLGMRKSIDTCFTFQRYNSHWSGEDEPANQRRRFGHAQID